MHEDRQRIQATDAHKAVSFSALANRFMRSSWDIQIPGMDGFELRRWVQQNRPHLNVLLTSGVNRVVAAAGDCGQLRSLVFSHTSSDA